MIQILVTEKPTHSMLTSGIIYFWKHAISLVPMAGLARVLMRSSSQGTE